MPEMACNGAGITACAHCESLTGASQAGQLELCASLAFTLGMRDVFCPGAGRFWAAGRFGRTFSSANTSCSSDCASAHRTQALRARSRVLIWHYIKERTALACLLSYSEDTDHIWGICWR